MWTLLTKCELYADFMAKDFRPSLLRDQNKENMYLEQVCLFLKYFLYITQSTINAIQT